SNILPLNANVAEHWLYLPSAFLIVAAILSLSVTRVPKVALAAAFTVWLAFLGARTFLRNRDWKDQRTFVERTIANGGDSARMLINLGVIESAEGRQKDAIEHFTIALQRSSDQPFALLGLAAAHLRSRDFVKSREQLDKASRIPF